MKQQKHLQINPNRGLMMVNIKKHKKKQLINNEKYSFNKWLIDFFGSENKAYYQYWGGINGAIHKKLNNWIPKSKDQIKLDEHPLIFNQDSSKLNYEKWLKHTEFNYGEYANDIKLANAICYFCGYEKSNAILWESTKKFLSDFDLKVKWVEVDSNFNEAFTIFKLIDEIKKYDILFFKNMTRELEKFLWEYGISECIDYIFMFYTEEDSEIFKKIAEKKELSIDKPIKLTHKKEPLYLKEGRIGFDLYQNIMELKKEVTAPTRNDSEYIKMKKRVRKRDNFTCVCCGYHNDKPVNHGLVVHHIYGFEDHIDYRVADSNCITLCEECHTKYHVKYGYNNNDPVTFAYFMRDFHTYKDKNIQTTLDDHINS